jgi:glycosyltransferase involved in cell wall biosynthesis
VKVRILHTLASEGRTSSEVYASELGSALRRLVDDPGTISDWYPLDQVTDGRPRRLSVPVRYLQRYVGYQWSVRGGDGAINHIVDHGYGHLAFSLDRARTVVSFHDALLLKLAARELNDAPMPRVTILGHRVSLTAIRRVARVITDSESARQDFLRFNDYDPARAISIPLGISEIFRPLDRRAEWSDQPRPLRILHVGHCAFYKNVEGILRSIPIIKRLLGFPLVFVKAGGAFSAAQQELIVKLGLSSQVEHLGTVRLAELPHVYANADLFLMPSWHEGFGLPALEAMACGTPVVASNRGSLPEVVGDAGLLVDPQDPDAIAGQAVRVLADRHLHDDLRRRGLERARTFTWERTALQTLAVYQAIDEEAA